MSDDQKKIEPFEQLRQRAEALIRQRPDAPSETSSDILTLIHELKTHQVELEIQNEELQRAQQELSELHREYENLYEFAPCGYVTLNERGLIQRINLTGVRLLGAPRQRLSGTSLTQCIDPDWEWELLGARKKAAETGDPQSIEVRLKQKGDAIQWVRADIEADRDRTGTVHQWRIVLVDISERKAAEEAVRGHAERLEALVRERTAALEKTQEQLIRKEKLAVLGQLAGGVGHELRNPLGAIKSAVYFLNMEPERLDEELREALQILDREITNSEAIIQSLFDYADPKAPQLRLDVGLNASIRDVLSRLDIPSNISVRDCLAPQLPAISLDPEQMTQVIRNLLRNAVQAMRAGGTLTVRSREKDGGGVEFSVSDTGEGIPEENLEKVFEPLFTTKARGTGLGLAICKSHVAAHEGTLEVESGAGKGTTFTVRLPGCATD